jgi:hypothetical protein
VQTHPDDQSQRPVENCERPRRAAHEDWLGQPPNGEVCRADSPQRPENKSIEVFGRGLSRPKKTRSCESGL